MKIKSIIIFLLSVLVIAGGCDTSMQEGDRPNIILIMTDDQGYGDLGFHGNPDIKTPVLDSLARSSTRFSQFYVNPVCAPTRAALMTGRYALRTGVYDTFNGGAMMQTDETTIAEILRENGYRTGIFGKWHLGDNYPLRPIDQGFEESLIHKGGGIGQPGDHIENAFKTDSSYFDPVLSKNAIAIKTSGYCSDVFTIAAMEFIDQSLIGEGTPFFLYLAYNAPHLPLQVPQEYLDMYEDLEINPENYSIPDNFPQMREGEFEAAQRVYAMVSNIDDNISALVHHLSKKGIADNTLLIFITDNGPQQYRYNVGLRGKKGSVYEGGIRVPCFMNWEGRFSSDLDIANPAANIDILPTLLDICGLEIPPAADLDGRSLLPLLEGESAAWEERTLYFEWVRGFTQPHSNIADDPFETNNICEAYPGIVDELALAFDEWYDEVIHDEALTRPPRIIAGSIHENPVLLSRQDWKGPKTVPWRSHDAIGYWDISFAREGLYDVKLINAGSIG